MEEILRYLKVGGRLPHIKHDSTDEETTARRVTRFTAKRKAAKCLSDEIEIVREAHEEEAYLPRIS